MKEELMLLDAIYGAERLAQISADGSEQQRACYQRISEYRARLRAQSRCPRCGIRLTGDYCNHCQERNA